MERLTGRRAGHQPREECQLPASEERSSAPDVVDGGAPMGPFCRVRQRSLMMALSFVTRLACLLTRHEIRRPRLFTQRRIKILHSERMLTVASFFFVSFHSCTFLFARSPRIKRFVPFLGDLEFHTLKQWDDCNLFLDVGD